ncbi:hypothetical protein TGAMA5MH_08623 [Trichoderma gamsii]|uniref:Rhamnogalacturonase A/B/Epimerase-like pectate lyase domain-containing protein n=1 Tax=Trichoderma gamsii TaxID=398673 RepID=A0A2K0T1L8_9HYPO|nr:hypothetical protein TGAMA5MH_08623 [Trichoderma gamsii]
MRSNVNNQFGTAPDKGLFNGPILGPIPAKDLAKIHHSSVNRTRTQNLSAFGPPVGGQTQAHISHSTTVASGAKHQSTDTVERRGTEDYSEEEYEHLHAHLDNTVLQYKNLPRQSDSYWLDNVAHGVMPLAPSNYTFFRNVKDYGAKGDGSTDDTAAINKAVSDGNRCGNNCGSTTVLGALVYFPPGTYVVSSPIIQYYYTQFVGDPIQMPTLQSTLNFTGIAIIDSDVYIPGGSGAEWYLNQNNFYRQIRNFNFDMTQQAPQNTQNFQLYVPTGIHWQVGQATSITNCNFNMAVSTSSDPDGKATSVGIFMENGSGGFMSDLTFFGGNAGMVIGSQQFTFRNLQFTSCLQAVSVLWNWGMTFQNVYVLSCYIAFNCTSHGGSTGQGAGSLSVLDSHFNGVPYAITVSAEGTRPNLILDNLLVEGSASVVLVDGGETIFPGSSGQIYVESWGMGGAYLDENGDRQYLTGLINPSPTKPKSLLDSNGRYFTQPKPLYTNVAGGSVIVATAHGVSNNMEGDQSSAINSLLASNVGSVIFFPAGIYLVKNTVLVPKGSIIVGEGWSQIMATGSNFADPDKPLVMVRVGNKGDVGSVEIQDMLFTVQGSTAGCILMEWNIAESSQGSAMMFDSHFRVGGAQGTNLQLAQCQDAAPGSGCDAASMLLHLTPNSSGYFENIWAWVADHDLDNPNNAFAYETSDGVPQNVQTQIGVYAGRGILIESQGPVWFWGSSSEHSELYNYQLAHASNIFLSHMQTETPYYQPEQYLDLLAYSPGQGSFTSDPTFSDCSSNNCMSSWALRALNSSNIFIYSAGFYSFFDNYVLGCGNRQDCQEHIIQTDYVGQLYLYNLFTFGVDELVSPAGGFPPPVFFNDSNQSGYTSEVAAWLMLSSGDASQLGDGGGSSGSSGIGSGIVYIDPQIWSEPAASQTVGCLPPCTLVLPPITLKTPTTISFPPWTTSIEVGWTTVSTISTSNAVITTTFYTSIEVNTTLTIPPITTTLIPIWNTLIPDNVTSAIIYPTSSILPPPIVVTDNPNPLKQSGVTHPPQTRTIYPPPFPYLTSSTSHDSHLPTLTYKSSMPKPTCKSGCGSVCHYWCHACNPLLPSFLGGCTGSDFCTLFCPPGTGPGNDGSGDPNDPDSDNGDDDDDECSTITTSDCRTDCISTSCTTTCSTYEGCEVTATSLDSTETPANYWEGTLPEPWNTNTEPANVANSVASSIRSRLLTASLIFTTGNYVTSIPSITSFPSVTSPTSTPGGGGSSSPKVTVIYVTTTTTFITTLTPQVLQGALTVAGVSSIVFGGKGGEIVLSNYNLNFIPPRTTFDVCSAGNFYVQGDATPSPAHWSDVPSSISFFTALTSGPTPLSSCAYKNSAPSDGDGGSVDAMLISSS